MLGGTADLANQLVTEMVGSHNCGVKVLADK
jgi:hypothetical protein